MSRIRVAEAKILSDSVAFSAKFWPLVERGEPSECWPWTGKRLPSGYGQICFGGGVIYAHRASLILHYGALPAGKIETIHRCDNPPCVNPGHLSFGTHAENMSDASKKKRLVGNRLPSRERTNAKLTEDDVRAIRASYATGVNQSQLARMYGVTQPAIGYIVRRVTWRGVE